MLHQPHRVCGVAPQVQGGHGKGAALLRDWGEAQARQRQQDCRDREMLKKEDSLFFYTLTVSNYYLTVSNYYLVLEMPVEWTIL